ncbi:MAG: hypothetical protein NZM44_07645 [Candidatus Calescibacterium sp.]|nr:hypothetical protein [Candidatus Calescibacterium sp.]
MKYIYEWFLKIIVKKLFTGTRWTNVQEMARFINLLTCDTVHIEGLTDYYKSLKNEVYKNVANIILRLIFAYFLNRAGIKVDYEKIYRRHQ